MMPDADAFAAILCERQRLPLSMLMPLPRERRRRGYRHYFLSMPAIFHCYYTIIFLHVFV